MFSNCREFAYVREYQTIPIWLIFIITNTYAYTVAVSSFLVGESVRHIPHTAEGFGMGG